MSIGCYGASLGNGSEYTGDYGHVTEVDLKKFHSERLSILLENKHQPDILACETIPNLIEAKALSTILPKHIPAWISFVCRDKLHVSSGELLKDCIQEIYKIENIVAIGVNCTDPKFVNDNLNIANRIINLYFSQKEVKPRLLCYPNSGEKWDSKNKSWYVDEKNTLEKQWQDYSMIWYHAGARMIGGCCRVYPEHITSIRETIEKKKGDEHKCIL